MATETKLRKIMKDRGITLKNLAEQTDLEIYQISKLASGKLKNPSLDTAKKICKALDVSLTELFEN